MVSRKPILVTGATGYIGGRLVPRLVEAGWRVRCLVRDPGKLEHRSWVRDPNVEIVAGDLGESEDTVAAMRGCGAAIYLVHSMLAVGSTYADRDRVLARTFAEAAEITGIERIVYLGGLGETGAGLSAHLGSRREVECELASGSVPVTVLRAAMIVGSGSASFEILRYLVERLPFMITPRWVQTECQPIGVRDVLFYLVKCLDTPETTGETYDIGGPEVVTYAELIHQAAELRGLSRRWIIPVPVLTPRLSSLWIHLVTPISARIARPLAEGLRNRVVCRDGRADEVMPHGLMPLREAMAAALGEHAADTVETSWTDAGVIPGDPDWAGGTVFEDPRTMKVAAPRSAVFAAVCRVGGGHGWYAADWLWRLRGMIDKLVGGPGLQRGRRGAAQIAYGDALDFWRVTAMEQNRSLELRAEMKIPGEAVLRFDIETDAESPECTLLRQTAYFKPRGLIGMVYWYSVLPLHGFVFRGMQRGIRRAAEREHAERAVLESGG